MEIRESARKHGIADDDMLHAVRTPYRIIQQEHDGEERILVLGADQSGRLLEVVVVRGTSGLRIIHADVMRPKFFDDL